MSEFRDQLQSLRDGYQSIRYDGDLAADLSVATGALVSSTRPSWQRWVGTAAALAAAVAMIAFVFIRTRSADSPWGSSGGVGMAVATDPSETTTAWGPEFAIGPQSEVAGATPTLWNSFESVPSMFEALGSGDTGVPSFPSLSEVSASLASSMEDQK